MRSRSTLRIIGVLSVAALLASGCSAPVKVRPTAGPQPHTIEPPHPTSSEPSVSPSPPSLPPKTTTENPIGKKVHWGDLKPGHCFNESSFQGTRISDIELVDCSQPHQLETVSLLPLPATWPGKDALIRQVEKQCDAVVNAIKSRNPKLKVASVFLYPTEADYAKSSRTAACQIFSKEPFTGSYK